MLQHSNNSVIVINEGVNNLFKNGCLFFLKISFSIDINFYFTFIEVFTLCILSSGFNSLLMEFTKSQNNITNAIDVIAIEKYMNAFSS